MQMKKITLLLMVFALAWSGQLKAVTLPETSKDGKVKWYFIQSMRQDYGEPMFYTVDGDLIRGRVKADYSDYATLAKQLWCFETEDGVWYTITNRYDGRKLGVGVSADGESLMMYDEAQAKFKLRDLEAATGADCFGLEADMAAPDGDGALLYPSLTGPDDNYGGMILLVKEELFAGLDNGIKVVEFSDAFEPKNSETITWYNIINAKSGSKGEMIVDAGEEKPYFTIEAREPSDPSAQWCIFEDTPGKYGIINRATGNCIYESYYVDDEIVDDFTFRLSRLNFFYVPYSEEYSNAWDFNEWNILPVGENQYAISGNIYMMRTILSPYTMGENPEKYMRTGLANSSYAWIFSKADTEVGIEDVVASQNDKVSVEDGRIIAPEGAEVHIFTPEGIELPSDSRLTPGIYIVTVNGKANKILVH